MRVRVRLGVRHTVTIAISIASLAACSSHPSSFGDEPAPDAGPEAAAAAPTLTCAWLRSADNCWLAALKEATACLPDAKLAGSFDAARATCSYADATVVAFAPFPATPATGQAPAWKFAVTKKGTSCMSFESAAHVLGNHERTTLTTALGSVELRYDDGAARVTCPDGRAYDNGAFHDLLDCETGAETLPGEGWGADGALDYFWLFNGVGAAQPNDHITAWSCKS
jgi:hypothetical protein